MNTNRNSIELISNKFGIIVPIILLYNQYKNYKKRKHKKEIDRIIIKKRERKAILSIICYDYMPTNKGITIIA